ncbi:TonB-dependent receptor [Pseudothauera nasutitermitis]|uniref:TonB-dependent receptor n=1 Tax=Pseudothauera nasutitermitis TaxID=2565930 RepID=A0A4S4AXQ1_9RHOO|nr:TonB-dependent receptor [Pseudothauera nasutitermitis]THF64710.1 TonB-dependent receptor [Pseudothauera nasutitermitis]
MRIFRKPLRRHTLAIALCAALQPPGASAADTDRVFTLGQITVTGQHDTGTPLGAATLDRDQLWDFSRDGLTEALDIMPGVITTPGSGRRNEAEISVRGFSGWRVPLMMDGIRLYLPADNRIDFDRFLTPDLAEIQVSKGYVSVLNGPDGMGGAINLVTRKPVKPFEAEVRATANLGRKGQYDGYTAYANLGGKQEQWYWQASAQQRDIDQWRLSGDFKPTSLEDGGKRDNSAKRDWRTSLKVGFTPNATDEYSLSFVKQSGEKTQSASTVDTDSWWWEWPMWDTSSLYWLSHTELGSKSYVKTRLYYNTFDNALVRNNLNNGQSFRSNYDDEAYGGSIELGTRQFDGHTLKGALHYRRDQHTEWEITRHTGVSEPKHENIESVWSLALEDTWQLTPDFDLVAGISRDRRKTKKAEDFANNTLFEHRVANNDAWNYQGAAIWRYREGGKAHFSASQRTRFPTVFERFSSRFGNASSNPYLDPEEALNLELGIEDSLAPGVRGSAALFHSKVKDLIQSVPVDLNGNGIIENNENQNQNVGKATFKGIELAITALVGNTLELGGNYTYTDAELHDPNNRALRLTTTPRHQAFLYGKWKPTGRFTAIPSVEYASARWSSVPTALGGGFARSDRYTLLNLKLEYRLSDDWDVSLAGRNLLDKDYAVAIGYPQAGRAFLLSTRYQF